MHSRLSKILFVSLSFSLFSVFSQEHNKASSQMYQARGLNLANAASSCRVCDSPPPPGANLLPGTAIMGLGQLPCPSLTLVPSLPMCWVHWQSSHANLRQQILQVSPTIVELPRRPCLCGFSEPRRAFLSVDKLNR